MTHQLAYTKLSRGNFERDGGLRGSGSVVTSVLLRLWPLREIANDHIAYHKNPYARME